MMAHEISAVDLQAQLKSDEELAFLDVREQGVHSQGHPLFATPLPLSRLELDVERLVPRKSVPIFLMDQGNGDDLAKRAAQALEDMGYQATFLVANGIQGWRDAGLEIFSGVNVPSKAFGEFVEMQNATPHISASQLHQRQEEGENIVILDSRPFDEYHRMCIPDGIDMPGAELVYRIFEAVPDETTPIVVNCAGRTRSIIGAQSLRNAGVKNPVMALKDGTMGWYLADLSVENNAKRIAEPPGALALSKSIEAAKSVAQKCGIETISASVLLGLRDEGEKESLYILDVRTKEEFLEGHIEGSQHSPGGQLVQATDEYVGVRNSTLVLVDDKEVRAWMTASWLWQLGWKKVFVLTDLTKFDLAEGPEDKKPVTTTPTISVLELDAVLSSGEPVALVDLANSLVYRDRHIPGAYWAIRSRLAQDLAFLPPVGFIIITADDEHLAHLAAKEVSLDKPSIIVRVLAGGNNAWYDAGLRVIDGEDRCLSEKVDLWYKPYDNKEKVKERMQEYLDWEVALIQQVERDGTARFQILDS